MLRDSCGVLYIAVGQEAVNEAVCSAKSLKKYCPDLSVTLKTSVPVESAFFDEIQFIAPSRIHMRLNKVDHLSASPYRYTLYLDNDTKVNHDIREMFDILDRFDIGVVQDFSRKRKLWSRLIPDYAKIPYSFPEYGSGVILFRATDQTKVFFKTWGELFIIFKVPLDQPTFRIALWRSGLRIHTLPIEYNIRDERNRNKWIARRLLGVEDNDHLKPRIFHWDGVHIPESNLKPHGY